MKVFPADIEDKLGFGIVRSRLVELAETEPGKASIEALGPHTDREAVERNLDLVDEWKISIASGDDQGLSELPDTSSLLTRIAPAGSWVTPEEALDVVASLRTARRVQSFFESRSEDYPVSDSEARLLWPDPEIEQQISRLFDEAGGIRDDASPELRRIRKQMRSVEGKLRQAAIRALAEAQQAGVAASEEPTLRSGRTVIPVRAQAKRMIDGLIVDSSGTGQTVFIEPRACVELNNELRLFEGQERREIVRILESISDEIRARSDSIRVNQQLLTRFDMIRAQARLSIELSGMRPSISEDDSVEIHNGVNPALLLIRLRVRGRRANLGVVPLSVSLREHQRVLIISGPNAGGKSVSLKTVGLLALMISYGLHVPVAEGTSIPLFTSIFADIGDEQSIETDLSTFSSHLASMKEIVETADDRSLVLVDEVGSSTDPTAGSAIAQALIEHLVHSGATAVITTHFGSLKAFAHETDGVVNGAMMFDRDTLSPTYELELGIPGSSFAFEIAQRTGFPGPVLERARLLQSEGQSRLEDLLSELERAKREAEETEQLLKTKLLESEQAAREASRARKEVEKKRDAILARAEHKAEELLNEANRTIERTIREIREAQAEKRQTKKARQAVSELRTTVRERITERDREAAEKAAVESTSESLRAGDQVVLDDGSTVGEIADIDDETAVVTFGSMQTRVAIERLTRVGGQRQQQVRVGKVAASGSADAGLPSMSQRIDVRGCRVAEAIPLVDRFIDAALRAGLSRVEILHGTGTGALRVALQDHLRTMGEVASVSEAPVDQGGAGVTVASLN